MSIESKILIGQLSEKSGLSRDTLRFYEKEGLLKSHRLINNYRIYHLSDLDRLRFVEKARESGFTIKEIKQILKLISAGKRKCSDYEAVARKKLTELDQKIEALQECRKVINNSLQCGKPKDQECASLSGI